MGNVFRKPNATSFFRRDPFDDASGGAVGQGVDGVAEIAARAAATDHVVYRADHGD